MGNNIIAKRILDFQKSTFDCTFNSVTILQQQVEDLVQSLIEQSTWLPPESKTAIKDWENIYNQGRNDFKEVVDNNYQKMEEYFAESGFTAQEEKPKM